MREGGQESIFATDRDEQTHEYPESIFREPEREMVVIDGGRSYRLTDDG
ncbi:hypothetical protein [Haloarchaeobius iranensis]|uniref:Uncharacterized protein n=1 Tax=Haloarchaeobius iranensis TaxID=996166 RepID=A0A1G9SGW6_9EURY|nr:hypothetical protein [Haloarchaeobius iranensis]SDM34738.1 hypothetical protein SAMN05192554_101186 [Haloarchaeobius iranensis]